MFYIFLLCSGCAALINVSVGYLLYGIYGLNGTFSYSLSVALAFLSGMTVSFLLNRRFTFPPSGRAQRQELPDFLAVSLVGLLLTTVVAYVLREGADSLIYQMDARYLMPETLAHVLAVGITAIYSFFAHKYVSFRRVGAYTPSRTTPFEVHQSRG